MNAKPLPPLLTTFPISFSPILYAKFPNIPKIVNPPSKLVNVSRLVTISASLEIIKIDLRNILKNQSFY